MGREDRESQIKCMDRAKEGGCWETQKGGESRRKDSDTKANNGAPSKQGGITSAKRKAGWC